MEWQAVNGISFQRQVFLTQIIIGEENNLHAIIQCTQKICRTVMSLIKMTTEVIKKNFAG